MLRRAEQDLWRNYSMSYNIKTTATFDKEYKRLAKHYPSLKQDIINFAKELQNNPISGTDLGKGLRKVRLAISSKGRGKSGGARVITLKKDALVRIEEATITLITIYDKSEKESLSDKELKNILQKSELV